MLKTSLVEGGGEVGQVSRQSSLFNSFQLVLVLIDIVLILHIIIILDLFANTSAHLTD